MKIIAIGDTHGRHNWQQVVEAEKEADLYIFMGDYFDAKEKIDTAQQLTNFANILAFKLAHPQKVVLLFGNHDYHYLPDATQQYNGYQEAEAPAISAAINKALQLQLLQLCYIHQQYLFSHAGFSVTWCMANMGVDQVHQPKAFVAQANQLLYQKPHCLQFTPGTNNDVFGYDVTQSPVWIRPHILMTDMLPFYTQVVGHTPQNMITIENNVVMIDTLGTSWEYLRLQNAELLPITLPYLEAYDIPD